MLQNGAAQERLEAQTELIVIAASYGGVQALQKLLSLLPGNFNIPIVIVQHRTMKPPNLLNRVLAHRTQLRVTSIVAGEELRGGTVYVAPPDLHAIVTGSRRLGLTDGRRIRHVLSSANPLFESASQILGAGVVAIVLSGIDSDAAEGVRAVKSAGGVVFVQDAASCKSPEMPLAALKTGSVDAVLTIEQMAAVLTQFSERATRSNK